MSRGITAPFLALALAVSGAAFSDAADPPSRAGRLSYLQGEVVMQPESGAPEDAERNRPLTLGDRLMTSRGSRAELSLGTASIRLDESTDLLIANLDDDIAQIELNSGTVGIHVRELREAEVFEIDTPNAAVTLRRPGDYRVAVDPQGATILAVRTGEAELDGGQGAIRLSDRQELRFTGIEQLADVTALGPLTAFD
ncbi:MAG: FecR domain-containing protein, partial [Gammaproteobacteria bacterium]